MFKKISKFNLFLIGFVLINILQSIFTPLIPDEAYYYMYSQNLAWGYFDHPPMVAYIIKVSSIFFSGELGVRFATVILNALMTLIIWKLIPEKNKKHPYSELLFFTILLSIPLFHVYSFITTPDAPLLFSFALYLLALKKSHEKDTFLHALFFGLAAALLLYSKYHGGVLILLSIVFQPHLLKRWTTYLAGFFALLLVTPHILWQYQHDFITFNYHLFQRTDGSFKISQVLEYLSGTWGVLNPALLILLIIFLIKDKNLIPKEYIFYFRMFYAFIAFFFLYSFRGRIEAHWVAAAFIPLSVVVFNIGITNEKFLKPLKYVTGIVVILIFALRIIPILDLPINTPFHSHKKSYYQEIEKLAAGKDVIFMNSYQHASKYSFYTGKNSFSLNDIYGRKNQYDLLHPENYFKGKDVFLIHNWKSKSFDSLKMSTGKNLFYKEIANFPIYSKLDATLDFENTPFYKGKTKKITFKITNPYSYDINFQRADLPYQFGLYFKNESKRKAVFIQKELPLLKSKDSLLFEVDFPIKDLPVGENKLAIILKAGPLPYQKIGKSYTVEVR